VKLKIRISTNFSGVLQVRPNNSSFRYVAT